MSALEPLLAALDAGQVDVELQPFRFATERQNQMLLFIKPEVFLLEPAAAAEVCRLIFDRLGAFGVEVAGAYMMSAETLGASRIMDRHYGYINQVSRAASTMLADADAATARQICGAGSDVPILGGHEVMVQHPDLSARQLDEIWATRKSGKLRSGLYVEAYDLGAGQVVIANGFHPYQLEHFTLGGRKICLMALNSDQPWNVLRSRMLGDTFPERAPAGSIRGELYRRAAEFGFESVTIANNCAHMSAGPFEAAFEFDNFLGGTLQGRFDLEEIRLGALLAAAGSSGSGLRRSLTNPAANETSPLASLDLFGVTEEIDALSSAHLYSEHFS